MVEQCKIGPISATLLSETEGDIDVAHVREKYARFRDRIGLPPSNPSDQRLITFEESYRRGIKEFLDEHPFLKSL